MIHETMDKYRSIKKTKTRNKLQRQNDYVTITDLYLKGKSQTEIAKLIGVSQTQVSKDLEKIREQWAKDAAQMIDAVKIEQLKKIDKIEQEAWQSWEKSKRLKKVTTKRGTISNNSPTGRGSFETLEEEELGDPRYMNMIQWCISERLKITGGYAPKKIAETDPTGTKEAGSIAREEILTWISNVAKISGEIKKVEEGFIDAEDAEVINDEPQKQLPETTGLQVIDNNALNFVRGNTVYEQLQPIVPVGDAQTSSKQYTDVKAFKQVSDIVKNSNPPDEFDRLINENKNKR